MKISDHIIVGVQYPKFCDFYNDLRQYTFELNNEYPNTIDEELIALCVRINTDKDNKKTLEVIYFTLRDNKIHRYVHAITQENDVNTWVDSRFVLELNDIKEFINLQPYVHDLNYFYQNI